MTNAKPAKILSRDRPVKSKKPAYFACFFALFFAAFFGAIFGAGGVLSIRRSTSSVDVCFDRALFMVEFHHG